MEGELGRLAEKFDDMAATLQQREKERDLADKKLRDHAHQQTIVAALGQCALVINDLETLFTQGALMTGQMLAIEYTAVFERLADGRLLMLAGAGWKSGSIGQIYAFDDKESQPGFSAVTGEVSVVDDITVQTQFKLPPLLAAHGVVGGITAAIPTRGLPFGVLAVFSTQKRVFTPDEVQFLLSAANTIGMAAERRRAEAGMQRLASFVKENPNPTLEISANGSITYFNPAAESLAQAIGRTHPREILPPDVSEIAAVCVRTGSGRSNLETKIGDRTGLLVVSSGAIQQRGSLLRRRHHHSLEFGGAAAAGAKDGNRRPARGGRRARLQQHAHAIIRATRSCCCSGLTADSPAGPRWPRSEQAAERAADLTRQLLAFSRKTACSCGRSTCNEVVSRFEHDAPPD